MTILDTIIRQKKVEVIQRKERISVKKLESMEGFHQQTFSLREFILDSSKTGIIAEFKRKSPSKGIINATADVRETTDMYTQLGASAVSVLTDEEFFGGTLNDLSAARFNAVPLLRKDFIVDEYQLIESKAYGADIILLIAACLSPLRVLQLASFAKKMGLNVLLEIHDESELKHVCDGVDAVGINNRNLKTFEVNLDQSIQLFHRLPKEKLRIAESGIDSMDTLLRLKNEGFDGFLIGEKFMKEENPGKAFSDFISPLKKSIS